MLHYWHDKHVHDDGTNTWHHPVNTIKGGSSSLFTIGNADFKLTTSVLLCLPQVKEYSMILNKLIDISNYIQRYLFGILSQFAIWKCQECWDIMWFLIIIGFFFRVYIQHCFISVTSSFYLLCVTECRWVQELISKDCT